MPLHRHAVNVALTRYEWVAAYAMGEQWDAWLRLPYDVKRRTADVVLVDPATDEEQTAMQRHLDLHHPTETLRGLGDASLLVATRKYGLFHEDDVLAIAFGTSVPIGRTEANPYTLGDADLAHEHIQFGTGTVDPLLELHYSMPLRDDWTVTAYSLGRISLYENDEGYRGPAEVSSGVTLMMAYSNPLTLRAGWSTLYQSLAHWDGAEDINSGLVSHGVTAGMSYRLANGVHLALDLLVPVSQRTLRAGGDNYEQGTLLRLGLSNSLGP